MTHPPHLSEWRPVISWRTEAQGHTFQSIIHSPAWMVYRSPGAGGGSSGRAEFAAACLPLEDSLTHDQPIVVLTDSKGFMTVASNWVGEGKDPLLRHFPDGDILARIINVLHRRVSLGLFTMFIKIRAHDGPTKGERMSTTYDGMVPAHILTSGGLMRESNTDSP